MRYFDFLPLDRSFDRSGFDCGVPVLNHFLKTQARQSQEKGFNRTYVAIHCDDPKKVVNGFYSVSMGQIDLSCLPETQRRALPKHPVPVGRIGRLAVDRSLQGQGLGSELLVNALRRIQIASSTIGAYAVVVDAKDESAVSFYKKYGFIELIHEPDTLFLPISAIPKS